MTTRADVNRLASANRRLVAMAQRDLAQLFASFDLSSPERVRDALLEVTPILVREYGDLAAAVTAEWYEEVRAASAAGRSAYVAQTAAGVDSAKVGGAVRWAAGDLFGDDPAQTLSSLNGAMQRYISYSSRETVRQNVERDPERPRFARVPSSAHTCAFCSILASRGFVYHSEASAGDSALKGFGDDFHDDCKCQIVPEWDSLTHHIEGYNPDALYAQYREAREAAGGYGAQAEEVAFKMRRMFPDSVRDGVFTRG